MTMIVDCHTHTAYSDGASSLEEMVAAAEAAGCEVFATTDHLTMPDALDPGSEVGVAEADLPLLAADFERVRDAHPGIELVRGFECDWYEGCEEGTLRWSEGATFLLGSVHKLGERDIDWEEHMEIWEELGADEVWRRYADEWCRACASSLPFDSMAHPDLPRRFENEGHPPTIDLSPLFRQMAECAHDTGRRIEVSTAGLRKSVRGYYPSPALLAEFFRAEVPITVGSDAHVAADACWGIRDAYAYAHATGYRTMDVPRADGSFSTVEL